MWIWQLSRTAGGDPAGDPRAGPCARHHDAVRQERRRHHAWSAVHARARRRAQGRGLKVCAWQYVYGAKPEAEAAARRPGRARRRRLLRDRRRDRVRGPLRAGPALHDRAARADRRRTTRSASRRSPTSTTTRPSRTRSSSGPGAAQFDLPQVYWKAIGGGLERRRRPHLPLQPALRPPDRADRPALRRPRGRRRRPLPPARRRRRLGRAQLVELAVGGAGGLGRARVAARRAARRRRPPPTRPTHRARRQGRPRRLGPGAARRRRASR